MELHGLYLLVKVEKFSQEMNLDADTYSMPKLHLWKSTFELCNIRK